MDGDSKVTRIALLVMGLAGLAAVGDWALEAGSPTDVPATLLVIGVITTRQILRS